MKRHGAYTLEARASRNPRMNKRRQAILDYIRRYHEQTGAWPSMREIGWSVGLTSSSTVAFHLYALCQLGHLLRYPHKSRSYRLPEASAS